ncbi:MAG TPA: DUF362 domain-containing protein [Candidatus Saccharimonadales bacterium]|nr:DUF362 domain-containing protein [Candidatus Saccharimonadales bacterium]
MQRTCIASAGLLVGGMPALGEEEVVLPKAPPIDVHEAPLAKKSPLGMPGLYPGRVIELHDSRAIVSNRVSQPVMRQMLEQGIKELTGESSAPAAWSKFLEPHDIVGVKINPSGAPACCSSPELIREIIRGVQSAGVPIRNIVVYDRFGNEMDLGSYQLLMPPGVRIVGVQDNRLDQKGYDANVYCQMDFFGEWETRSYMASIVANEVTKIINVPTLKDHSASGVTGCLKNVAYGTFNNVARSHQEPYSFTNPLIGVMCTVEPLRSKVVLNIMDGTRMVWHGGPLTQNQDFIYQAGLMLVSTDPVAMDTIELELIEKKRREEGAPSVWEHKPSSLTKNSGAFFMDASKNLFYRQPGHIAAAGKWGLGVSDLKAIDLRKVELKA